MDYQKIYNQIIERAQSRTLEGYKEKHHIIPKCIGGNDSKENLIYLTSKEHFLCHLLLIEIYPLILKLKQALWLMSINKNKKVKYKVSSRLYERLKKEYIKTSKGKPKPKGFGERIISLERNRKIGISNSKPKPKDFGSNQGLKLKGIKKSKEETKRRLEKVYKPIIQLNLNGNFIKKWDSAKHASNKLKINYNGITQCVREKIKSSGNFVWVLEKKYDAVNKNYKRISKDEIIPRKGKSIEIEGIKYRSLNQASRDLNIPDYLIRHRIKNGKLKYKWLK